MKVEIDNNFVFENKKQFKTYIQKMGMFVKKEPGSFPCICVFYHPTDDSGCYSLNNVNFISIPCIIKEN